MFRIICMVYIMYQVSCCVRTRTTLVKQYSSCTIVQLLVVVQLHKHTHTRGPCCGAMGAGREKLDRALLYVCSRGLSAYCCGRRRIRNTAVQYKLAGMQISGASGTSLIMCTVGSSAVRCALLRTMSEVKERRKKKCRRS